MRPTRITVFLCTALLPAILWAGTAGSISGQVKDPSGAVIPGATVTATNTATNIQTKAVTDDRGFSAFPSLPVGRYNIKVEQEGFGPQTTAGPPGGRARSCRCVTSRLAMGAGWDLSSE